MQLFNAITYLKAHNCRQIHVNWVLSKSSIKTIWNKQKPASSDLSDPSHLWKQKFMSGLQILQRTTPVFVGVFKHTVQSVRVW